MSVRPLALVTGSLRRLGAAIAVRLAAAGYDIALHASSERAPDAALRAGLGGAAWRVVAADLADAAAVDALVARAGAAFGRRVDVLVNNASLFDVGGDGVDAATLARHLAVNAAAPVALAHALAGQGGRAVVNILDQRIANPPPDQPAYTVSKGALAAATRALATALAPAVRVNAVAPGLILPTEDYDAGQVGRLAAMMPLARHADPAEVADAVAWLADARSVTGQTLFVDGGAHLRSFARDFVHLAR